MPLSKNEELKFSHHQLCGNVPKAISIAYEGLIREALQPTQGSIVNSLALMPNHYGTWSKKTEILLFFVSQCYKIPRNRYHAMGDSISTPLASSRRVKQTSSLMNKGKSVRWGISSRDSEATGSPPSSAVREPSSPDMLGKLSLALSNMRNLKEQLAQREAELLLVKSEKEKYQSEHGKMYSQITSIRTRCSLFESQLAKKAMEVEELKKSSDNFEFECSKLRKMVSDDTSKHTNRIKHLEMQVSTLKLELSSKPEDGDGIVKLEEERERLLAEIEELGKNHQHEIKSILAENEKLSSLTASLTSKLEESRAAMVKVSSEKIGLQQDLERFRQEHTKFLKAHKDTSRFVELEERLAEIETERSNAKMTLKKAMRILDEGESLRLAIEEKDARIKDLEAILQLGTKPGITLPSIIDSLKHMDQVESEEQPRAIPQQQHQATSADDAPPIAPFQTELSTEDLIKQKLDAFADTKSRMRQFFIK